MVTQRLLCVGAATSIDRYLWVDSLAIGSINRPTRVTERAGGKSLNAARAAIGLGVPVNAVALSHSQSTDRLTMLAASDDLPVSWIEGGGPVRQCLCILDESSGVVTELYEPISSGSSSFESSQMVDVIERELSGRADVGVIAFSGRVAPDGPKRLARDVVDLAHRYGVLSLVDSDAEVLREALKAKPDVVKVNRSEAAEALSGTADDDLATLASELVVAGAGVAIVTDGPGEIVGALGDAVQRLHFPPIPGAMAVGSGDSFLAGISAEILRQGQVPELSDLLLAGTAAARVNAREFLAGSVQRPDWESEYSALQARTPRHLLAPGDR